MIILLYCAIITSAIQQKVRKIYAMQRRASETVDKENIMAGNSNLPRLG